MDVVSRCDAYDAAASDVDVKETLSEFFQTGEVEEVGDLGERL